MSETNELDLNLKELFVFKYKPKSIEEFYESIYINDSIKKDIGSKNITNLIIAGPSGSGKKTFVELLSREILGEFYSENIYWWNASMYGGLLLGKSKKDYSYNDINIAQKNNILSIKDIAMNQRFGNVPFKIIVINEADYLQKDTQQAFRVLFEKTSNNVRFIFITKNISSIIDPILSRSNIILFNQIEYNQFKKMINNICKSENIKINEKSIKVLYSTYQGNLSKTILFLNIAKKKNINLENAANIITLKNDLVDKRLENFKQDIINKKFSVVRESLFWLSEKYSYDKLKNFIFDITLDLKQDKQKNIILGLSKIEKNYVEGDKFYSLLEMVAFIIKEI